MSKVKYKPTKVTNRIGIVNTIPVLKYVPQDILMPCKDKTCNHNNVASEPIGVIFGPKSEPKTLAKINPSRITPDVSVSAIAMASIITVGKLFMIDDKIAAIKPIDTVATNNPCDALASITRAKTSVNPAFLSPNTTTYIP